MDYLGILVALIFLLLNAFFVLAEFAIVKVRFTRLEELAAKGVVTAEIAKHAVKHLDGYLSAIQLGITMASLGLGWIGEPALAHLIKPIFDLFNLPLTKTFSYSASFAIAFVIITGLHVVIGELAPKNMAIRMPEKSTLLVIIPLNFFYRIVYYPMWILNESANYILKLLNIKSSESELLHSEGELMMILGQSQEHGRISLGRLMMFENLFDFGRTLVKEIMTPKNSIVYLATNKPWIENLRIIKEKKLSRYPLARTSADDIFGFIHFKDIAMSGFDCDLKIENLDMEKFNREIHSILEDISSERALREFQEKRMQMALVKNSKGEISGLLTMEDIIEELTGEIRDEFDQAPPILLSSILIKDACDVDIKIQDRFQAIGHLLERLHLAYSSFNKEDALKAIIKREKNFSTALGHQTAFPHARLEKLSKSLLVIGKSKEGIYFPSPDNQLVRVIFVILTPFNEPTSQLNILSQLSGLISNLTIRKRLFSAKSPEQVHDIIKTFENKVMK
jgi:CBS domain containing-hemolysin-like protein